MDVFLVCAESHFIETALDEVFHGLDVVIGRFFDLLDFERIGLRKVGIYGFQGPEGAFAD